MALVGLLEAIDVVAVVKVVIVAVGGLLEGVAVVVPAAAG